MFDSIFIWNIFNENIFFALFGFGEILKIIWEKEKI